MKMMTMVKMMMTMTLNPTTDFCRSVRSVCAILINFNLRKSALKGQKQKKEKTNM